jgi:hypothetical protein
MVHKKPKTKSIAMKKARASLRSRLGKSLSKSNKTSAPAVSSDQYISRTKRMETSSTALFLFLKVAATAERARGIKGSEIACAMMTMDESVFRPSLKRT